ncbi:MAG: PepSY domain-containing protein [Acidocella sp.]|nr:PepSY domain-containing protein [Acidocella sp.]
MAKPRPIGFDPANPRAAGLSWPWRGWTKTATRRLSWLHRWLGVVMCLFFSAWFLSGAVMLYVPFPALSAAARYAGEPPIATADVLIAPAAAAAGMTVEAASLVQGVQDPLYIFQNGAGQTVTIDGRTGSPAPLATAAQAATIAARFTHTPVAAVAGPYGYDQWIVHQHFDPYRPFYRVSLADYKGTQLYVSARTYQVLQLTTLHERFWNWAGAVVHWIYPTIIRRSYPLWDNLVWCLSLVGIFTAAAGLTLGITRMRAAMRHPKHPGISAFRGLFRWHHLLGLTAGLTLFTWIFSGWLSVDHGRIFSTGIPTGVEVAAARGITLPDALRAVTLADLRALPPSAEIDFVALDGQSYLVGHSAAARPAILPAAGGPIIHEFPDAALASAAAAAWPQLDFQRLAHIKPHDWYANLPDAPLPPHTRRVYFTGQGEIWVDIDADTGIIQDVMDPSRRVYCWLFDGLHTFDIPGLPAHPFAQKLLMLVLLAGGFALSASSVVLAFRRVRRLAPKSFIKSTKG